MQRKQPRCAFETLSKNKQLFKGKYLQVFRLYRGTKACIAFMYNTKTPGRENILQYPDYFLGYPEFRTRVLIIYVGTSPTVLFQSHSNI